MMKLSLVYQNVVFPYLLSMVTNTFEMVYLSIQQTGGARIIIGNVVKLEQSQRFEIKKLLSSQRIRNTHRCV